MCAAPEDPDEIARLRAIMEIRGRLAETAAVLRNGGELDETDKAGLIEAAELARKIKL